MATAPGRNPSAPTSSSNPLSSRNVLPRSRAAMRRRVTPAALASWSRVQPCAARRILRIRIRSAHRARCRLSNFLGLLTLDLLRRSGESIAELTERPREPEPATRRAGPFLVLESQLS